MAERLAPFRATQVARVRYLVLAGTTNSVEKVALFYNPASGAHSQALTLRSTIFAVAKAKAFLHLGARLHVGLRIPHYKGQFKLVNGSVFKVT
jgi:hypothetical protein